MRNYFIKKNGNSNVAVEPEKIVGTDTPSTVQPLETNDVAPSNSSGQSNNGQTSGSSGGGTLSPSPSANAVVSSNNFAPSGNTYATPEKKEPEKPKGNPVSPATKATISIERSQNARQLTIDKSFSQPQGFVPVSTKTVLSPKGNIGNGGGGMQRGI